MSMSIVITMAGLGSRFRNAGYGLPKYEIEVRGRTLFSWSLHSLVNFIRPENRFIFICLLGSQARPFIASQARELGISDWTILELGALTDGQATSALAAKPALTSVEEAIMVYNIDTYVEPHCLLPAHWTADGWIPCFEGIGDAWSFIRLDEEGRVAEVREKKRISPYASIGLYGFPSFALYEETYRRCFADPANLVKGERYIAPMYNLLIAQQHDVRMSLIPIQSVHPLGTPDDVQRFTLRSQP
jgi:hypothetical protein